MAKRRLTVAAIQSSFGPDMAANIAKIEGFVREAAKRGAQVVLAPELFQSIYFPTRQDPKWFATAYPVAEHPSVIALQKLAEELDIVIPISFFEKDGPRYYNSVAIANGVVVMPVYGTPTQDAALEALQAVFPGRSVIGVPSRGLLGAGDAGGGSFHCITQQEPA